MSQRIGIIGAGPTGLGAAYRLQELAHPDWTVYERNSYVGGLAASFQDSAGFTYDIGGHVMFSHYKYFDDLVDRMLGSDFTELMRESWIWMFDRWIPYPLQNNIRHLPASVLLECLEGLVDVQSVDARTARNFGEWIDATFGSGIARCFMQPYNFKVWAHPLDMMSKDWIAERVSVIDLKHVLANVVHGRDEVGWGPNNKFRYPLYGGTGGLYQRFLPYVSDHLQLNREVVEIDVDRKVLRFNDGGEETYDVLLTAAPIPELLKLIRPRPEQAIAACAGLQHSHGLVVGVGIQGPCPSTKCWTYFPEPSSPFYRVTYLSNYSPTIAPDGHFLLLTETSWSDHKLVDPKTIVDSVIDGLVATRLIQPEDRDRIVTTHTTAVEYFYPVPTLTRDAALAQIHLFLRRHQIHSRGRFGAWCYETSNMDHSVMQGVEFVNWLLLGEEEKTWTPPREPMVVLRSASA